MITQLLDFDWPASILAGWHFRAQENGLMSPDGVCAISAGPAGHETSLSVCAYQSRFCLGGYLRQDLPVKLRWPDKA